ncbi:TetR/AcrR family transcriptional regulator [Butyrivibrio sp. NC3005]|uniref:TetR/AcrR family transcriptional regulator n=1 Tax=Butyrivibrio sp. NC3005 TaxID=1280685 RepID=UPI000404A677|nr:TetR/AcrR family transcriptional regulator [Butyrivibrio sp. NC3005]
MGKAFTEEEKIEIKERIDKAALEAFRRNGVKEVAIRDIANAAGISVGAFYHFYDNKEAVLKELIGRRAREKNEILMNKLAAMDPDSIKDVKEFVVECVIEQMNILKPNKAFNNTISDSLKLMIQFEESKNEALIRTYMQLISFFEDYFQKAGRPIKFNRSKLGAAVNGGMILFMNMDIIGDGFDEVFRLYVTKCVEEYVITKS